MRKAMRLRAEEIAQDECDAHFFELSPELRREIMSRVKEEFQTW